MTSRAPRMPRGMPLAIGGGVVVRPFRIADAPSLARNADDERIAVRLRDGFPHPYRLHHARDFLARIGARYPPLAYALALDDEVIGGIGVAPGEDVHRYSAELGYWVAVPYWGRGIATRAVRAFTPWAMDTFRLMRIFATVFQANPASARVLEKNGFKLEGRLRSAVVKRDRVLDMLMYSRTRPRRRFRGSRQAVRR